MNRRIYECIVALLAGLLMMLLVPGFAQAPPTQQKPPVQPPTEEETGYTVEEYEAYEKATQEPDLDKRPSMLFGFMDKYPKSKLMPHIETAVQTLLYEHNSNQKWDKLLALAELWEKRHPDELQTWAYITDAALNLGQDRKFLEYAQKIYAQKPSPNLALGIYQAYRRTNDEPKYLEWAEKLFAYPEFAGEYDLRMMFVQKYMNEKNYARASGYATQTLKSLEAAKKPQNTTDAEWNKRSAAVRRSCNYIIGLNYYDKQRYPETIRAMETSIKWERSDLAYFYIGQSLWRLNQIEEAISAFAKAVVLGGESKAQSRESLEKLYKGLHNQTTIGIEKVYRRARAELGLPLD